MFKLFKTFKATTICCCYFQAFNSQPTRHEQNGNWKQNKELAISCKEKEQAMQTIKSNGCYLAKPLNLNAP
jgi:hypothetical protein